MRTLKIDFNTKNLKEKTKFAKKAFEENRYTDFEFDLTGLNLIDAAKTALSLSTRLFCKDSQRKIKCLLRDEDTLKILKSQKLKNTFLSVNVDYSKRELQAGNCTEVFNLNRKYAK